MTHRWTKVNIKGGSILDITKPVHMCSNCLKYTKPGARPSQTETCKPKR